MIGLCVDSRRSATDPARGGPTAVSCSFRSQLPGRRAAEYCYYCWRYVAARQPSNGERDDRATTWRTIRGGMPRLRRQRAALPVESLPVAPFADDHAATASWHFLRTVIDTRRHASHATRATSTSTSRRLPMMIPPSRDMPRRMTPRARVARSLNRRPFSSSDPL